LLRKTRKAFSGKINSNIFNFTTPKEFQTVTLTSPNIAGIIDAIDSDGNKWYEVDYLAQDLIYDSLRNTNINSPIRNWNRSWSIKYKFKIFSISKHNI
jgi:hypothetical protein